MTLPFHPLANIFPLIEGAEFDELCASIKANGLRDAIVVSDGMVLDGRNRQRACEVVGVDCIYQPLPADDDPLEYVVDKNIRRRHLTTGQKAYALAEYETLRHGGARKVQDANLQLEPEPSPSQTRAELAEKAGVSERSIASAAVVRDRGVDDLKDAVKQGDIAVSAAEKIARMPEAEQPQALAKVLPRGARSIMGSRQEPDDSLDFFPTPPWATRALFEQVLPAVGKPHICSAWEPACGEGHIADVLQEYVALVRATDIFDYGYGDGVMDFLDPGARMSPFPDFIITNPPFGDKAVAFVLRALENASVGVAMFFRLQWIPTKGRYESLFRDNPPTLVAFFTERVPIIKGEWNPTASTATDYIWLVWLHGVKPQAPFWIPPGQREALTRPDDAERFTAHPVVKRSPTIDGEQYDKETGEIHGQCKEGNPRSPSAMVEASEGIQTGVLETTPQSGAQGSGWNDFAMECRRKSQGVLRIAASD